jgi:glutathione peroxidase
MTFFELEAESIDGNPVPLEVYQGKVVLVVNTASQCGFTPQYEGLEQLWKDYKDKDFVVLAFPSNDFGAQEPGTAEEIETFCKSRYGVTFPLFAKVKTKGQGQSPVYKFLNAKYGEPQWNFHKYLVGKDGQVKRAFPSKLGPESMPLRAAIDAALKE